MVSQQLVDIIIKAEDQASAAAEKVDESLKKIKESSSSLGKIPGFDTLKTKLSSVAESVDSKLGGALTKAKGHLSNFRASLSSVGASLSSSVSAGVDKVRAKLQSLSNGAKTAAGALNFLKSAGSMMVGMLGYDLVNSIMETTRASLNARSGIQAFAQRLNMSASDVSAFQKSLDDLQNTYKKIDMDVVGQQATDMAYRLGLPKTSLAELTETTAIFTDAMQRNGRSAEDSMLAMSDAMDGQFTRLKEIGISQEDLMKNGWSGDINDKTGLLTAMNKALKEQHYDDLAKSVDTLDDAWQVLSITLSNLLEAIILPLTPAIVAIIDGFTGAVNAVKPFISMLQGAWGALPDWLKDTAWAAALVLVLYYLGTVIMSTVVPALAAAALAAIDFAMAMLANPFTWILVALVAIALAVYEVGKAFGWWDDVGGMLEAIWAGLQRLWDAFINHPDVQAAISAISSALSTLWGYIQQAGQAVMDFFNINSNGNFDIVHAIIEGIGLAWDMLKDKIMLVVSIVQGIIWVFGEIGKAGTELWESLTEAWDGIMEIMEPYITIILDLVTSLVDVFDQFKTGQMDLPALVVTVLSLLWNAYLSIITLITNAVLSFAGRMLSYALQTGSNFVNGIVQWISQLPGRVASYMSSTLSRIVSIAQQWVSNAVSKASSLVSNVASTLSSLPGKIASALSGVVNAIVKPFQDAYNRVAEEVDKIKNKASEVTGIAFGGETAEAGELIGGSGEVSFTGSSIDVNVNEHITLDLENVPAHIDTGTLIRMLSDRDVLKALTGNKDFQELDSMIKGEILAKTRRANGGI